MMVATREAIRDRAIDMGAMLIRRLEGVIAWGSLVGNPPVFDSSLFPWAGALEVNWESIRSELDAVMQQPESIPPFQELSRDQRRLTQDEGWRTYFFYAFGFRADRNCERCPETARLLETIPGMTSAFFSIFEPGKHLPDHRGAFKGLVRYHLGLTVPCPDACGIRVDSEICHWQEGRSLIFDDTYRHEAWNDSDQARVVLFVDFKRPLRFPANLLNWSVLQLIKHSPFVKDSIANYNAWEARLDHVD